MRHKFTIIRHVVEHTDDGKNNKILKPYMLSDESALAQLPSLVVFLKNLEASNNS